MQRELKAYVDILEDKAAAYDIPLADAYKWLDMRTSYYRHLKRDCEVSYATARKLNDALEELKFLRDHRAKLNK